MQKPNLLLLITILFLNLFIIKNAPAQNTIIDNSGQASIFFINDYPHARHAFWGNNDLAANGIAHDDTNWFIASQKRDYLGHSGSGSGWKFQFAAAKGSSLAARPKRQERGAAARRRTQDYRISSDSQALAPGEEGTGCEPQQSQLADQVPG